MALNQPRAWLIAYDIADKRRLSRLHRFIKRRAVPVQYSVFYFEGSSGQVSRFLGEIETYINVKQDDVRAYPLPHDLKYDTFGRGSLPLCGLLFSDRTTGLSGLTQPGAERKMQLS